MDAIGRLLQNIIDLERLANTVAGESSFRAQVLFKQISDDLATIDIPGVSADSYQRARLDRFLARLKERLRDYRGAEVSALKERLALIGRFQGQVAESGLEALLGSLAGRVVATPITQGLVRTILNEDPFQGALLKEHVDRVGANVFVRVRDQVRMGMLNSESTQDLVRRVRGKGVGYQVLAGKKIPKFDGGVLNATTRETEALVRTAVNFVANKAMDETYQKNKRVLNGVEFVAVLDDRTTIICMSHDGDIYEVDDPEKPQLPLHYNCRSVYVPVVDWEALGLTAPPDIPRAARDLSQVAEEDLQRKVSARRRTGDLGESVRVPTSLKAEAWLRLQSVAVQDKMLGRGRAKLWRDGEISLSDLIRRDNTTVPLQELLAAS